MNITIIQPVAKINNAPDNFAIGHAFEDYVVTLFNKRRFRLLEWRSDKKATNGVFPLSNSLPDLEFDTTGRKKYRFAIECKWRKNFYYGGIDWANGEQIFKYQEYQNQNRIQVYVAIGIGGVSSNPEKLFITPLDHICMYTRVFESHLFPYKKNTKQEYEYAEQLDLFNC